MSKARSLYVCTACGDEVPRERPSRREGALYRVRFGSFASKEEAVERAEAHVLLPVVVELGGGPEERPARRGPGIEPGLHPPRPEPGRQRWQWRRFCPYWLDERKRTARAWQPWRAYR